MSCSELGLCSSSLRNSLEPRSMFSHNLYESICVRSTWICNIYWISSTRLLTSSLSTRNRLILDPRKRWRNSALQPAPPGGQRPQLPPVLLDRRLRLPSSRPRVRCLLASCDSEKGQQTVAWPQPIACILMKPFSLCSISSWDSIERKEQKSYIFSLWDWKSHKKFLPAMNDFVMRKYFRTDKKKITAMEFFLSRELSADLGKFSWKILPHSQNLRTPKWSAEKFLWGLR